MDKVDETVWPVWLPFPISWVRSLANLFVFSAVTHTATHSLLNSLREGESSGVLWSKLQIHTLICLLLHFFCMVLGHHCVVRRLIDKQDAWWPGWLSWREGVNASIVVVVELMGTGIFILFLGTVFPPQTIEQKRIFIGLIGFALVTIAAYLYHYDFLVRRHRAAKLAAKLSQAGNGKRVSKAPVKGRYQPPKPAPTPPPPPIDPIDLELQQLREQIRKMNPDQ